MALDNQSTAPLGAEAASEVPARASPLALTEEEMERSRALERKIASAIDSAESRRIAFSDFLKFALYDPQYGYYTASASVIGAKGDFVTAPELGDAFGKCLARKIAQISQEFPHGIEICEFGAGNGTLAAQILNELRKSDIAVKEYSIIEVSPRLQDRQRSTLAHQAPWADHLVRWQTSTATLRISGAIIANELVDAIPFELFRCKNGICEQGFVTVSDGHLKLAYSTRAADDFARQISSITLPDTASAYRSELHCQAPAWLRSALDVLHRGSLIIIDYGFPEHEYYHPERRAGTMTCHRRHHVHQDPLSFIGCQDISAHVDFSALARVAAEQGAIVNGFSTLAGFLLDTGIAQLCESETGTRQAIERNREIMTLTSPSEMGELFKVMELAKAIDGTPDGFRIIDHRHRLHRRASLN